MKVIISAGGTGGHIYPALAIINKLKEHYEDLEVLYIGTHNRMEKDIIPKYNIPYKELEIYGLNKKQPIKLVKNIFCIAKSYKECIKVMKEFKPDIVIGVGGYVTYPVIMAASKLKIKTIIHEQNSIPGKSNKMLAKYVDKIAISLPSSKPYFDESKVVLTGNPCSENAIKSNPIDKESLGLSVDKKLVVIVAGSLGSSTLNNIMINYLKDSLQHSYEIVYITGKAYYEEMNKHTFPKNVFILPYLDNLPGLLKNTDVLVTRAGASITSEVIALRLPSIFIPSPYVANNHQFYNAMDIKKIDGGEIIEERNLDVNTLVNSINSIINSNERQEVMKANLGKLAMDDSAEEIYKIIKELLK